MCNLNTGYSRSNNAPLKDVHVLIHRTVNFADLIKLKTKRILDYPGGPTVVPGILREAGR